MTQAPLVGRAEALARLRAAVADGVPVLIRGEPGIGKTRLVDELRRSGDGTLLVGRADAGSGAPPLWPWLQALGGRPERATLAALAEVRAPAADTVDPGAAALLHRAARTLAFDAVLDGLSGGGRLTIVLEDLHWADESTLRLLVQAAGRRGLAVVGTFRDTEQGAALRAAVAELRRLDAVEIGLRPWDDADVAALLPDGVHASWAPVVRTAGAGVPLLVTALLRVLVEDGRGREPAGPGWPLGVPDQLADLTAERLERLDPAARTAVEVAAVVGTGCTPGHVRLLADLPAPVALAALEAGAAAGLLAATGPLTFDPAHALFRDAVYGHVPPGRRLAWHAALGAAIDDGALPGESVTHRLRAAVDPESCAAAVDACRRAAAVAANALAFDRSVALLDAALALPGCGPRVALELAAAEAEFAAGRAEAAVRRCKRVAATSSDPAELVRAALTVRGIGGSLNVDLVLLCEAALRVLPPDDLAGRARVLAQRALAEAETVGSHGTDAPSREALELAERSGSPVALADALRARQHATSHLSGVAERQDVARRMLALAASGGPADAELWGRVWLIDAAFQLGDLAAVDAELARLGTLAARLGWPIARWHQQRMTAARHLLTGRFAEAESAADGALATARRTEDVSAVLIDGAFRFELLRLQGRYGELRSIMEGALRDPVLRGMAIFTAHVGVSYFEMGDLEQAARMLDLARPQLAGLPEDGRWQAIVALVGELAALLGDVDTVATCVDLLTPWSGHYLAGGSGSVRCDGATARIVGIMCAALGRTDDAVRHLTAAIAMEERIGALPHRLRSEIALAALLSGTDRPRAVALARRAAETARRLGMAPALARADALLGRLRAAKDAAIPLTAREREVLAALARGRTNRQIASELVLSERTVETHVTHVLGKLGLANRAEAAAWAVRNT